MSCCGYRNFYSLRLTKFRPLPLLMLRFICHKQRSATSPLRYPSVYMMHSVHHIYGASERRLDEFAHRIHFAFAKRIFAAGEISRNGAYYTYFIFSNSMHHIYGAFETWLGEPRSTNPLRIPARRSTSLLVRRRVWVSSPKAKYPSVMHTIRIYTVIFSNHSVILSQASPLVKSFIQKTHFTL